MWRLICNAFWYKLIKYMYEKYQTITFKSFINKCVQKFPHKIICRKEKFIRKEKTSCTDIMSCINTLKFYVQLKNSCSLKKKLWYLFLRTLLFSRQKSKKETLKILWAPKNASLFLKGKFHFQNLSPTSLAWICKACDVQ